MMAEVNRVEETNGRPPIIGRSEAIREVLSLVEKVASSDVSVLIQGESGTGKELIARELHRRSQRATEKFLGVSCAAISETLLESELFGHEEGSFTGASSAHVGLIEKANRGTLFLDEIAETSLAFQKKLLRVVQEHELWRVGGNKVVPVDVRLICATNRDLTEEVRRGAFREDLLYRINVVSITLPPLRERKVDISDLVEHFVTRVCADRRRPVPAIAPVAVQALEEYRWPGNVRQLENVIERAVVLDADGTIGLDDLPSQVRGRGRTRGFPKGVTAGTFLISVSCTEDSIDVAKDRLEKAYLEELLRVVGGNVSEAARIAGVGRAAVHQKLRRHQIDPQRFRR